MRYLLPSRQSTITRLNRILGGNAYHQARFFILVDENTYTHCLPLLVSGASRLNECVFFEVPVGEKCKEMAVATQVWQSLLESGADRDAVVVNLGGGCISDLGGYVAAGYKRGIRSINIPTTLVGMIDAAIGGKTALNLAGVKNPIGLFHDPDIIAIEPAFLDTLPHEELTGGICEMLKTFLIGDPDSYNSLCDMILQGDLQLSGEMIVRCVEIKQAIVHADPYDRGLRHILNLGHTFGHAIEAYSHTAGQTVLSHGHAVGIGMVAALYLSVQKLGFPAPLLERYREVISRLTPLPRYTLRDTEALLSFMRQDKKNSSGDICCVLLQESGAPVVGLPLSEPELRTALLKI